MDKCCGEKLITIGTAIAFQIAENNNPDDLAVLGSLFTVIGDQLSLLSITKSNTQNNCSQK